MSLIPVVIVDDETSVTESDVLVLEDFFEARRIVAFNRLSDAVRELSTWVEPFMVILDHDFRLEADTKLDGWVLAETLRSTHPWGLYLPICYRSGRMNEVTWKQITSNLGPYAPTLYEKKGGEDGVSSVVDTVQRLDTMFDSLRATALRQAEYLLTLSSYDEMEEPAEITLSPMTSTLDNV